MTSNCNTATFTSPIIVYATPTNPCGAVTGGYRYRGSRFAQLNGVYFYADYCTGRIWGAVQNGNSWATTQLLDTDASISTFGEDQNGELYLADLAGGQIYRIVGTDTFFAYLPIIQQ